LSRRRVRRWAAAAALAALAGAVVVAAGVSASGRSGGGGSGGESSSGFGSARFNASQDGNSSHGGGRPRNETCPLELAAARACFVDDDGASSGYASASVAQSVCEACMSAYVPGAAGPDRSPPPPPPPEGCALDEAACRGLAGCDCGPSCGAAVAAYLLCATGCLSPGASEGSDPTSELCQGLGSDPSEPTAAPGAAGPPPPSAPPTSSPAPTPAPPCPDEARAFESCVDPARGDASDCALCLLGYWPPSSSDGRGPTCDELRNATCAGLDGCAGACNGGGCREPYISLLSCRVGSCAGPSGTAEEADFSPGDCGG
jgi:hypothetical protein